MVYGPKIFVQDVSENCKKEAESKTTVDCLTALTMCLSVCGLLPLMGGRNTVVIWWRVVTTIYDG